MKVIINGKVIKLSGNRLSFDGIALAASADYPVEKDADGVPVAWRLFKLGDNQLIRNGEQINLVLSAEDMQQIEDYFACKGVKIPVDSRHYLYHLAQQHKVDETDVLNLIPDGRGALAFGDIAARADGVWLENADYKPLARQLMQDGIFRYFSPVLRGLADGRLRITSVALENEPSINNLDAIAASAESADIIKLTAGNASKENPMKKLLTAIAGLLGVDSIALGADQDVDDSIINKLNNLKSDLGIGPAVRDSLALAADANVDTVKASIAGLLAKGQAHDSLKTQVDALALAAETDKRQKLIDQGLADGKLSNAMVGGSVINIAYTLGEGQFFMGYFTCFRRIFMQNLVAEFSGRSPVALIEKEPMFCYRIKTQKGTLVAAVNSTSDIISNVQFKLNAIDSGEIKVLDQQGVWQEFEGKIEKSSDFIRIKSVYNVNPLDAVFFLFS